VAGNCVLAGGVAFACLFYISNFYDRRHSNYAFERP